MPDDSQTQVAVTAQNIQVSVNGEPVQVSVASQSPSVVQVVVRFTGAGAADPSLGFTLNDGANIAAGTTTGSMIGTDPSQKLAFWGATPTGQLNQLNDVGPTVNTGFDSIDKSELDSALLTLSDAINAINLRLKTLGLVQA